MILNNDEKFIYLFRHGETDWNVEDRVMGQIEGINTSFTSKGYSDIEKIAKKIEKNNIEAIYTSDFDRALNTAIISNKALKLPLYKTTQLRGFNMGKFQGMLFKDFIADEEVVKVFSNYDLKFKDGESVNELVARMYDFIIDVCINSKYKNIAMISHSAAISNLISFLTSERYISVKECKLLYTNNKLYVLDYTLVDYNKLLAKNKCYANYYAIVNDYKSNLSINNNLYFIRHGENLNNPNMPNALLPLSLNGIVQSYLASNELKNKFDILISSPTQRTKMTSSIILNNDNFELDNRLLERFWGNDNDGNESLKETELRVMKFLKDVLLKYKNLNILFVTHGGLMKVIQKVIEGNYIDDEIINNGTIIKYGADKRKTIKKIKGL